jgi:hypothetical protein
MNTEKETTPHENPPPRHKGKIIFLFLALAPIPIGFFFDPTQLFDFLQGKTSVNSGPLIAFNAFALICCMAGAIGMCGGYEKGKWGPRLLGVCLGVFLWLVEAFIISFIGCCQGLSHI